MCIRDSCDTMLFLGGKESTTLKEISETLGKETIDYVYKRQALEIQSRVMTIQSRTGKTQLIRKLNLRCLKC